MAEQPSEATVLFADVSGSTKLYETMGDAVAHAAIEKCIGIMRDKTLGARGKVIQTIGDEVMSQFATVDGAADAAIDMQLAIAQLPPVGKTKLGIRIGFNHGPIIERDGDLFGDAVNLASRLSHVAAKGQIITARETVVLMSPMLKFSTRPITTIQVKGRAQEIQVYELMWQQSEDATTMAPHKAMFSAPKARLRLKVQDTELVLSADRPVVALGRDQSADLIIRERMASRAHGRIERRLDKFILTDHSANGTFVTIEGDREIVLRREEFTLRGHGWIALGQSRATAANVVEFFCE
ncbi:MAG TPA: adenylate/guanylate cyclase domain-containing protein [Burkholderiales bacterium]|nr:adenylate/guanylate cyclase domain-containing protein [Burkholderiales bacterium]